MSCFFFSKTITIWSNVKNCHSRNEDVICIIEVTYYRYMSERRYAWLVKLITFYGNETRSFYINKFQEYFSQHDVKTALNVVSN